ncbi:hypothetical protein SRB5_57740 [Streptomyces sp. RB5]|uniref:Uncharacterized protein n=1 Tax=Streptomyces smaragdinus TaxID=2585196 RepID=A0A7K0CQ22_9ACTN|nr:hypothetical protein [Streptomyces smaragdinus]
MPDGRREWIERSLRWCVEEFGPEPLRGEVALPGAGLIPPGFDASQEQAERLVRRVCAVMGADPDGITVSLFEGEGGDDASSWSGHNRRRTVGRYLEADGGSRIELDVRKAQEPPAFAAVIAHELAHVRLLGENRSGKGLDDERLTDLLTVYLGMGVLTANAAYRFTKSDQGFSVLPLGDLTEYELTGADDMTYRLGYLSNREFGYALAYYTTLRGDPSPTWAIHLNPGVQVVLRQGLSHLASRPRAPRTPGEP